MASRTAQRQSKSKPSRGNGLKAQRTGKGVARYYLLYEYLSGALNDGTIPAGSALPSEPELVARYKLSRTTVRRALGRLEDEGRIIRRRGSGTFARQNKKPTRLHLNLNDFFGDSAALASQSTVSILRFEIGPVPPSLRELHPQLGTQAMVVQRVHRHHGTPYSLTTAYVPEEIGKRIRRSSLDRSPLTQILDQLGGKTSRTDYTTGAVAADAVAAKRLDVQLGAPLLRMRIVLADARGHLRAFIEHLARPDLFSVKAQLERSSGKNSNAMWHLKRT